MTSTAWTIEHLTTLHHMRCVQGKSWDEIAEALPYTPWGIQSVCERLRWRMPGQVRQMSRRRIAEQQRINRKERRQQRLARLAALSVPQDSGRRQ